MGASASTTTTTPILNEPSLKGKKSIDSRTVKMASMHYEEFAISIVMPIYYTKALLEPEEQAAATACWKSIVGNRSAHFQKLKKESKPEEFPYVICSDYYSELFYERLFNVHPGCKSLFAGSKMKMRVNFMSIISLLLDALDDDTGKFVKTLENLARVHNRIGVKAVEYGIGCEILMYCMQKSVGDEWTPMVSRAWIKIFSRILDVIIPIVIRFEIENFGSDSEAVRGRQAEHTTHVISTNSDTASN